MFFRIVDIPKAGQNPLDDIEKCFEDRAYERALELLDKKNEKDLKAFGPVVLSNYHYLYARCLYELARFNDAHKRIRAALRFSRKTSEVNLIAWQKYYLALILHGKGLLYEAARASDDAYDMFELRENYNSMLAPLDLLARIHYDRGQIREAMQVLHKEVQICDENADKAGFIEDGIRSRINLAQILIKAGRFREALESLKSLETREEANEFIAGIYRLYGIAYTLQMDTDRARIFLNDARKLYAKPGFKSYSYENSIVCLEYLGLNEHLSDRYNEAIRIYNSILDETEIPAAVRAQSQRFLIEAYIASSDFGNARRNLGPARKAIDKSQEKIELGALFRAEAQIHAHYGHYKKVSHCFNESIRILRDTGALYELARTFLAYGRCDAFRVSKRAEFLRRAKGLFAEMNVSRRVGEIDEKLKELNETILDPIDANIELREITIPGCRSVIREVVRRRFNPKIFKTGHTASASFLKTSGGSLFKKARE
jgi:tetratricopeptide (TPR) repeat protein